MQLPRGTRHSIELGSEVENETDDDLAMAIVFVHAVVVLVYFNADRPATLGFGDLRIDALTYFDDIAAWQTRYGQGHGGLSVPPEFAGRRLLAAIHARNIAEIDQAAICRCRDKQVLNQLTTSAQPAQIEQTDQRLIAQSMHLF